MITRRDLVVAALAAAVTLAGAAGVRAVAAPDVMGSTIFDWKDMTAAPNKTGEVRQVVRRPTATLDELEIHITTLNPGETPHAPHRRGRDGVPTPVAGLHVVARQRVPVGARDAVEIVDHLAVAQRQLGRQLLRAWQPRAIHVDEAEAAFVEAEHGDVGGGAGR